MKKTGTTLTIIMCLILASFFFSTASTSYAYSGVEKWFTSEIHEADCLGIIPDVLSNANMRENVTRSEFCKTVLAAYNLFNEPKSPSSYNHFTDTKDPDILLSYESGIVSGYSDGTFRPNKTITRQEMFKIIYNLMAALGENSPVNSESAAKLLSGYQDTAKIPEWAKIPTASLINWDIAKGTSDTMVSPLATSSRSQAVVITYRSVSKLINSEKIVLLSDLGQSEEGENEGDFESSVIVVAKDNYGLTAFIPFEPIDEEVPSEVSDNNSNSGSSIDDGGKDNVSGSTATGTDSVPSGNTSGSVNSSGTSSGTSSESNSSTESNAPSTVTPNTGSSTSSSSNSTTNSGSSSSSNSSSSSSSNSSPASGSTSSAVNPSIIADFLADASLTSIKNNTDKYAYIFGSTSAKKYSTAKEAESHMVTIQVPVWKLNSDGSKTPSTKSVKVNSAIKDVAISIFTEIYESDERFPINTLGGYSWRGDSSNSSHKWGIAFDINATQNYYISTAGKVYSGSYWHPGTDELSIREDSDVVKIFAKYGFAWGGNAWKSSRDYMHFCFFAN